MRSISFSAAALAAAILGAASAAQAGVTFYTTASDFHAAAPGATDPTGMSGVTTLSQAVALMEASPSVWRNTVDQDADPITLGDLTFIGRGGRDNSQGFFSTASGITGFAYQINNPVNDSYEVDIAGGGATAFGFDLWEPNGAACNTSCIASSFTLTAYDAGGVSLGARTYTPAFITIFLGFTSTTAVAKVTITESGAPGASGCCIYDNEYSGDFQMVSARVADGGVPEPAAWALMIGGFFGAGAMLRRRRYAVP